MMPIRFATPRENCLKEALWSKIWGNYCCKVLMMCTPDPIRHVVVLAICGGRTGIIEALRHRALVDTCTYRAKDEKRRRGLLQEAIAKAAARIRPGLWWRRLSGVAMWVR
jgi:hypothetical protein